MKESYEEELANRFGLQRRGDCGNNVFLSVRAEGQAGQLLSSPLLRSKQAINFACRPCPDGWIRPEDTDLGDQMEAWIFTSMSIPVGRIILADGEGSVAPLGYRAKLHLVDNANGTADSSFTTVGVALVRTVPEPVPEPSSITRLITGATALIGYGYRRKRKKAA